MVQKKVQKMRFLAIFSSLGSRFDSIAYDGSPKCFSTHGSGYSSYLTNKACTMCINCAKKVQKMRFLAFFSTLMARIDSISHMMIVLNVFQHMAVAQGHAQLIRYA